MQRERITKLLVERIQPGSKDVVVWDQEVKGFGLKITPKGRRVYFAFYRTLAGQQRKPTIGVHGKLTAENARQVAKKWIAGALIGQDVSAERQEARTAPLVKDLAARYLEEYAKPHKKPSSYKSDKSNLEHHVLPLIGTKKVSELKRSDIEFVKTSVRAGKTAKRKKARYRGRCIVKGGPGVANRVIALLSKMMKACGWGLKRIARQLGCSLHTVRGYVVAGGVKPFKSPERPKLLDGLEVWLRERFFRHGGNADVVRQELASEHGIVIGLRSVELRVQRWRRELKAQKRATVRFETAPGQQLQIDFGDTRVWIGDEKLRVHLFVATLGYSRRLHVRPSLRERQADWFEGMEGAFLRFGGVPAEVLFDNPKALVEHHDAATREVRFNPRLHALARY